MSKTKKSDTDQQQFWQMVLDTFKTSGLSVRQFCQKEGVSEASFYSWRKRLSSENEAACQLNPNEKLSADDFIQVSLSTSDTCSLELVLISGNTLRINSDIDGRILNHVLSALKQAKLC
jgi:transposase